MKINQSQQNEILGYIKDTFDNYVKLSANDRERLYKIFD